MKAPAAIFPHLRITSVLGSSPSGESYLAAPRGKRNPRWVLKRLPLLGAGPLRARLRDDILEIAGLSHPTLALPESLGRSQNGDGVYILRPFIEGSGLASALQGKSPRELISWLIAAAQPLFILHRFGILHRNLKPANFLVPKTALFERRRGGFPRVILCDPAWWPEEQPPAPAAAADAPESGGREKATFASDLYSLGAVFHQLVTGWPPPSSGNGRSATVAELRPDIPKDLDRCLRKLLHPEPRRRYQDIRVLLEDLGRLGKASLAGPWNPPQCFLNRAAEIDLAVRRLDERGGPALIAVFGETGIGKTAFLKRLALEAQFRGFRTALARCYPEALVPLAPLLQLLEQLIPRGPAAFSAPAACQKLLRECTAGGEAGAMDGDRKRLLLRDLIDLFKLPAASPPAVLFIDEIHFADSLTMEFLAELAREIAAAAPGSAGAFQLPALALAWRSESPYQVKLRVFIKALEAAGAACCRLELPPLEEETVEGWLECIDSLQPGTKDRISAAVRRRGLPFAIQEALRLGGSPLAEEPRPGADTAAIYSGYLKSLGPEQVRLLTALALLNRPAEVELLSRALGAAGAEWRRSLDALLEAGTLVAEGEAVFFKHDAFRSWLQDRLDESERKAWHRSLALALERGGESPVEERARHWLLSDAPRRGIKPALAAARRLARTHEDQRALYFYQEAFNLLPPERRCSRFKIAVEMAAACSRLGEYRRGILLLEPFLDGAPGDLEKGQAHARLGILRHRAGEISKAELHFQQGLALLSRARRGRWLLERSWIETELVEMASHQGDYPRAEAICARALKRLGGCRKSGAGSEIRRLELILLANLAHLRLRRFQFDEARELFEKSLELGEAIGAVQEKSFIFNHLGILHIQENRFPEAIECYRQAQKLSARLGDHLMLAAIHSNLAVLHSKTGEPEAAAAALLAAAQEEVRCESARARLVRLHSSGMADLYFGRYSPAIGHLKAAIALGEELQDAHILSFDLVYLGECCLYRGAGRSARAAFERAWKLGSKRPQPIAAMIRARQAVLFARRKNAAALKSCLAELQSLRRASPAPIPYLEAWNRFFSGWALRLSGERDEAQAELEAARRFFAKIKAPAGEISASLELGALEIESGKLPLAAKRFRDLRGRFACGQGPLKNPMLSARFLAYQALAGLSRSAPDFHLAGSLLLEAESFLIGHQIADLEGLINRLKRRLPPLSLAPLAEPSGQRAPAAPSSPSAGAFIGASPKIRQVLAIIRQVAPADLPVLITGETGSGKELVARAIHEASPRRSEPFLSINCAAVPESLLEVELFGCRRGAFSGAEEDRPGLFQSARGGTLLFDEIGDMPIGMQGKILRSLDQHAIRPVGAAEEIPVSARSLFTTHHNLRALVREGRFREDLFFRLSVFEIDMPPLRERLEDLPALAEHFLSAAASGPARPRLNEECLRVLSSHNWPGNVRELKNLLSLLALTSPGAIEAREVRRILQPRKDGKVFPEDILRGRPLPELLAQLEREYLYRLHADCGGDLKEMAARLGIKERALYGRFRRLGIRPREL